MNLKLYYYNQCPFCQVVLRKIDSLDLQTHVDFCNTLEDEKCRDEHLQKTGRRTVPCLYIDDDPMFESRDIVMWLEKNQSQIKGE